MSIAFDPALSAVSPATYYPDSDGEPMADNTVQFDWIGTLKWNAEAQFRGDPDVFVAGDHLIYPVEGDADIRQAPDVYVAFGRQKGDRGSYRVFEEDGVFPQVVIEVWSPNNRYTRMRQKFEFYDRHGAEEYYIVYPEFPSYLEGWRRTETGLTEIPEMDGYTSPRLGWRFALAKGQLVVYGPDGRPLLRPDEIAAERDAERQRANREKERADAEGQRADAERTRAEQERQLADAERTRADRLAAQLRALGLDPDAG